MRPFGAEKARFDATDAEYASANLFLDFFVHLFCAFKSQRGTTPASAGDVPVLIDAHVHSCNGTATPCAVLPDTSCKATSQCRWTPPCVANPVPQSGICRLQPDQGTCLQHPECLWVFSFCGANQSYCPSVTTQALCTPLACNWMPAFSGCDGIPNCTQLSTEFSCGNQPGCSWN